MAVNGAAQMVERVVEGCFRQVRGEEAFDGGGVVGGDERHAHAGHRRRNA